MQAAISFSVGQTVVREGCCMTIGVSISDGKSSRIGGIEDGLVESFTSTSAWKDCRRAGSEQVRLLIEVSDPYLDY